jgi:hypothetical protein
VCTTAYDKEEYERLKSIETPIKHDIQLSPIRFLESVLIPSSETSQSQRQLEEGSKKDTSTLDQYMYGFNRHLSDDTKRSIKKMVKFQTPYMLLKGIQGYHNK